MRVQAKMSDICRLCLGVTTVLTPLYGAENQLLSKIRACLPFSLSWSEHDGLPTGACERCARCAERLHEFALAAEAAQRTLLARRGAGGLRALYEELRAEVKEEKQDDNKENLIQTDADEVQIKQENEEIYDETLRYSSDDELTLSALQAEKLRLHPALPAQEAPLKKQKRPTQKKTREKRVKREKENRRKTNDHTLFPEGTAEEDKKWQCLTCLIHLESRPALLSHYKSEHGPTSVPAVGSEESDVKNAESRVGYATVERDGEGALFECLTCGKRYKRRTIARHVLSHATSRPYRCKLCGRTYKTASDIVLHGRAHNGFKTLSCGFEHCAYSTVYPGALADHRRRHDARYKYTCEECGKGFNVRTWFLEHGNVHSGERPFACADCPKTFHFSRYLTTHRSEVHGARRHRCPRCPAALPCRRRLRAHLRTEHGAPAALLCERCGLALSSADHLRAHRRAHLGVKPHACGTCDKAFVKKCNLKLHERTHSGERPYGCTGCGKAFSQRSTLVVHMRHHTGVRPYSCLNCPKSFVARGQLSAHQKTCF